MAGDPMKKVQAGDKLEIPAETFNTMIDAAEDFLRRQRGIAQEVHQSFRQVGIVLVRNNSGTDRTRGEILGINSPIIDPSDNLNEFKGRVAFDCGTPGPGQHIARFVVLLEPIADGKIGRAVIAGVVPAYIYVYEECHEWADVHPAPTGDEAYCLTSAQYGAAQILWKQSGTGYKWAVVRLFGPELIQRIELATDLVPNGSAYAYPLKPDGTPDLAPDRRIQVHELLNKHWGWGRNEGYYRGAWGYVKGCLDSDRWEVLNLEQMAHQICVTLTEDMGYTSTGTASCTLNDAYRGTNPTLIYYSGSNRGPLKVKDPQNLFPRALSGAKAKATWDNYNKEYHLVECQQMATMIKCTANADAGPEDAIEIQSTIEVMQPITGQSPVDGNAGHDPTETGIHNTFSEAIASGSTLIAAWNEQEDRWELLEVVRPGSRWAKAQSDWEENGGDPQISVKLYSPSTQQVSGNAFYVKLPRTIDADPIVFQNRLLVAEKTDSGDWVCVTDYMDGSKIGHIRFCKSTDKIPEGWREMDGTNATWNMQGRTLIGRNQQGGAPADEDAAGDDGGYRWHGTGQGNANNHGDHPDHFHEVTCTGTTVDWGMEATVMDGPTVYSGGVRDGMGPITLQHNGPFNGEQDTDNRMPFRVGIMMERYK